jgi:thymidylate kinase
MPLIELAGASGVGKTTVAPLLARRLRETLGGNEVAALPEKDQPRNRRHWRHFQRRLWFTRHPRHLLAAWRLSRHEPVIARTRAWLDLFSTLGIGRHCLARGCRVALVDQGVLRLSLHASHAEHLPRDLLPDLVLQLVADPATLEQRRIQRAKAKLARLQGQERLHGAARSLERLAALPAEQRNELLEQFSAKFCEPALNADELADVLAGRIVLPPEPPRISRCDPDTCAVLEARGVIWKQIDNSAGRTLNEVVEEALQAVLAHLELFAPPP